MEVYNIGNNERETNLGTSRESLMVKDILEIASKIATAPATMIVRPSLELITKEIIKSDYAHKIGVHMRDLRVVFQKPSASEKAEAAIYVNETVVLFAIEGLQVVFSKDDALIFNAKDSPLAEIYIEKLRQLLRSSRDSFTESEDKERFSLDAFDIALGVVCDNIYGSLNDLAQDPLLVRALHSNLDDYGAKDIMKLSKLLPIKEKLRVLRKRCAIINHALESFCQDEQVLRTSILCPVNMRRRQARSMFAFDPADDGSQNNVNRNEVEEEEDSDMELIFLEDLINQYFLDFERAATQAESVLENIANQEAKSMLQLDIVRNKLMRFSMYVTIASTVAAMAALLTGIFGMNLEFPAYLQDNLKPFKAVVLAIAIITPILSFLLSYGGHKYGWIP